MSRKLRRQKAAEQLQLQQPQQEKPRERQQLKALNEEQRDYIRCIHDNNLTICMGKSGSGKTHVACGMAAQYLNNGIVDKIILTRPCVGAESIGFLPGTQQEKVDPYLKPLYTELNYFLDVKQAVKQGKIEVQPIFSMRGLTVKNSFLLADEIQNLTFNQWLLLLTRFGDGSKYVLMGDIKQSDLMRNESSGAAIAINRLRKVATKENQIAIMELERCVRHPMIDIMLGALESDS